MTYASRAGKKPYIEDVEVKGDRPEEEVAAEAWGNYLLRDRSIVVDTFQGQLKSTVSTRSLSKSLSRSYSVTQVHGKCAVIKS